MADFSLPGFDGLAALRVVRQFSTTLPFILVSGTIGEERAIEALKSGATDYVLKTHLARLVPAVRRAMHEVEHQNERRRLDAAREETNRKLQVLSRRLVQAQETERRRIARELHDEIGQTLTLAQLNLQAALPQTSDAGVRSRVDQALHSVERVLEQVHDISLNLRPSMLDDLGLEATLRWYANRQATAAGLQIDCHLEILPRRLDTVIETECFRIAQEALTNVVRHSGATKVCLELSLTADEVQLRVKDDGRGFELRPARERLVFGANLGLLGMEERAALAGGSLIVQTALDAGTEIRAALPLRWHPEMMPLNSHE